MLGRSGHPECFDYVERYLRNYISNLQFIITPEFEAYYRKINAAAYSHHGWRAGSRRLRGPGAARAATDTSPPAAGRFCRAFARH